MSARQSPRRSASRQSLTELRSIQRLQIRVNDLDTELRRQQQENDRLRHEIEMLRLEQTERQDYNRPTF